MIEYIGMEGSQRTRLNENYLDYETEVRFVDGIISQNQDWQWFVAEIERF